MVDIELLVRQLRKKGHTVEDVHVVPKDAGDYELVVDGTAYNLEEARHVLELDQVS